MFRRDPPQPLDAPPEGRGLQAAGSEGGGHGDVQGDSPGEGPAEGPLAPEVLPGGIEGESDSEMRPRENDSRKSDGIEEFKRMERNAEDARE